MSMQQIMRHWHDFLRNREGECLTMSHGENSCAKRKHPENVCPFPHALTFHLPSRCRERQDVWMIHPSMFLVSLFPHCACTVHHQGFHPKCCGPIMIISDSIMLMHAMHSPVLQNCVLFYVFLLWILD